MKNKIIKILLLLLMLFVVASCQVKPTEQDLKSKGFGKSRLFQIEDAQALRFNDDIQEVKPLLRGNYNEYQRHWMNVAYEISNKDKEFMLMLKGENGYLNHDRQSLCYENGVREPSFGFCQIHRGYHPHIVNDPRFFKDPKWQLRKCYELWKGGTVFYAYERIKRSHAYRKKVSSHFNF